jgi:hypothetical protein
MSKNGYQEKIAAVKQFTPFQTAEIYPFWMNTGSQSFAGV